MKAITSFIASLLFLILLSFYVLNNHAHCGEWNWHHPFPNGNSYQDVWMSSANDLYAVGYSGTIVHYDGNTWSNMNSGTSYGLLGIWGSSSSNIFAVGDYGTILHYDGNSWTPMDSGITQWYWLNKVWGNSADDVYAVGYNGIILHYDGSTWSPMTSGTTEELYDVWGSSGTDMYTVGVNERILHYDGNVSQTWSTIRTGTNHLRSIWGTSSSDVFVVGSSGTILHYDGIEWSIDNPIGNGLTDIWGSSSNNVYAVGTVGALLHYNGVVWTTVDSNTTEELNSIYGSSDNHIFALGRYGIIQHFNGSSWASISSLTSEEFTDVWGSSDNDIFAVGSNGTIFRFNGSNWSLMDSGTQEHLMGVGGISASNVFVVGYNGTILHYNGSNWSSMDSNTNYIIHGIWGSSGSDVYAVGEYGTLLHYNGSQWSSIDIGISYDLRDIWGSSKNDIFIVGMNGTIFHYNGSSWLTMDSGSNTSLLNLWGKSSSDVYAISYSGALHYNGVGWSNIGTIYEASDIWGSSGSDIFAVGYGEGPGNYYYDGSNWTAITLPLDSRVSAIWGNSENSIFAVGRYGAILKYVRSSDTFPRKPLAINPTNEAVIAESTAIELQASAFNDLNGDTHTHTQWRVVRYDTNEVVYYDDHDNLTQHTITAGMLDAGLKYVWQVRYKDSSGDFSPWSVGAVFKIGNSVTENLPEISAGKRTADFGMISIVHWPDDSSPQSVFNIDYDVRYYRIGTYDPLIGTYIEFDDNLEIQPGRAYWMLAREGLIVNYNGVPVSKIQDIKVYLHYNATTQDGWNMIAPPNDTNYHWAEILVARENESGAITFGPVPVSSLANDNTYIDKRLWSWEEGSYFSDTTLMEKYKGYWVKTKQNGVYLTFSNSAQANLLIQENRFSLETGRISRLLKKWIPKINIAFAGDDTPPLPMGAFHEKSNENIFGGCFIEILRY